MFLPAAPPLPPCQGPNSDAAPPDCGGLQSRSSKHSSCSLLSSAFPLFCTPSSNHVRCGHCQELAPKYREAAAQLAAMKKELPVPVSAPCRHPATHPRSLPPMTCPPTCPSLCCVSTSHYLMLCVFIRLAVPPTGCPCHHVSSYNRGSPDCCLHRSSSRNSTTRTSTTVKPGACAQRLCWLACGSSGQALCHLLSFQQSLSMSVNNYRHSCLWPHVCPISGWSASLCCLVICTLHFLHVDPSPLRPSSA